MLPKIVRLKSGLSHRSRWTLVLFGLALLALPTWHQQAHSQFGGSRGKPEKPAAPTADNDNAKPVNSVGVEGLGVGQKPALDVKKLVADIKRPKLPTMAPPAVEFYPELSPSEKAILAALEEPTDLSVSDESLEDVLEKLTSKHEKFNIVLDKKRLEQDGFGIEEHDISLNASGISLRSCLKIVLSSKDLAYVIDNEVIKVTATDTARQTMLTRIYPVRDLVSNVDADYVLLKEAIQQPSTIESYAWFEIDGEGGTISILPATGCLVICQCWQGHEDILKLLRALRKANEEMQPKSPMP